MGGTTPAGCHQRSSNGCFCVDETHQPNFFRIISCFSAKKSPALDRHYGGLYTPPPSKKHDPGKIPGTRTMCSPNFGKQWEPPPPGGWSSGGGGFGHFFSDFGDRVGGARDLPEKLANTLFITEKQYPFLSTFWPFWAKVAQTGEVPGSPWSTSY